MKEVLEYIRLRIKIVLKFIITLSPLRIYSVHLVHNYLKYIDSQDCLIICPGGIGDTVISCLLEEEYVRCYKKRKVYMLIKKGHADVVSFLCPEVTAFELDYKKMRCLGLALKPWKTVNRELENKYIYGGLSILDETINAGDSFIEDYKIKVFGLDQKCKLKEIREKITYNTNSNKILIAPYTVSVKYNNNGFWKVLCDELKKNGYEVYINSNDKKHVSGTYKYNKSLMELLNDINKFACFISYRSGLNDLLETVNAKQIIIYPNEKCMKYFNVNLLQNSSKTISMILDSNITSICKRIVITISEDLR